MGRKVTDRGRSRSGGRNRLASGGRLGDVELLGGGRVESDRGPCGVKDRGPVSYTHLTLPTICSV
eukprot:3129918-Rhodomonas_salina.1